MNYLSFPEALQQAIYKNPEAFAVFSVDDSRGLTFLEWENQSDCLASFLLNQFGSNKAHALALESSPFLLIAILAIWKSRSNAMILGPELPSLRAKAILEHREFGLLFSFDFMEDLKFRQFTESNLEILKSNPISGSILYKNPLYEKAYSIFSSGSTGTPKEIKISHEAIVPVLTEQIKVFEMDRRTRTLSYLSPSFDAYISEFGTTALAGGCLYTHKNLRKNPKLIYPLIESFQITHIFLPPSILGILDPGQKPKSLKVVVTGGEVCPKSTVQKWASRLKLVNAYGPTETTICSHLVVCDLDWDKPILGDLLPNRKQRVSEEGELILGGIGLGEYSDFNDEKENKFFWENGERWFRTGDMVREIDGEIEFLGRRDGQWKIRGNRIEQGELEIIASKYPEVTNLRSYLIEEGGEKLICLCYGGVREIDETEYRAFLNKNLPAYMIPSRFVYLPNFILNANGKWDEWKNKELLLSTFHKKEIRDLDSLSLIREELKKTKDFFNLEEKSFRFRESISELRKELPILKNGGQREKPPEPIRKVLLLGGLGYLGKYILKEIVISGCEIFVLTKRLNALQFLINDPFFEDRRDALRSVHFLQGDASLPNFGLNPRDYQEISQVDTIFNVAGSTNAFLSRLELKKNNVDIVKNCILLSNEGKPKTIHHISTLSIFLHSDFKQKIIHPKSNLSDTNTILGGYAQSKWMAEELLKQNCRDYKIYRLGLLVSNQIPEDLNPKDFFTFFLKSYRAWIDLDFPQDLRMDYLPVGVAARKILSLSGNHNAEKIVHIFGKSIGLKEIKQIVSQIPSEKLSKFYPTELELEYTQVLIQNGHKEEFQRHPLQLFLRTGFEFAY
jgi:thioester reductase-like protein/acyl-CoA synthetase (AMP-forming)/AMP-acid ligase II